MTATLTGNSFMHSGTGVLVTQTEPTPGQPAGGQATVTASGNAIRDNVTGANGEHRHDGQRPEQLVGLPGGSEHGATATRPWARWRTRRGLPRNHRHDERAIATRLGGRARAALPPVKSRVRPSVTHVWESRGDADTPSTAVALVLMATSLGLVQPKRQKMASVSCAW